MEIIVDKKNKPFNLKFAKFDFNDIPNQLKEIESDCKIYYHDDNNEKIFLAKYVKNVLHNPNLVKHLEEFIKGKPIGTYNVDHNHDSKLMYNTIYENTLDIQKYFDEDIKEESDYHFFYNSQMSVHRDYRYKQLRSLNVMCNSNVIGYFVLSDFDIYFDIKQGDLLLFDASQYHYMQRTNNKSAENYRLAINMI